MTLTSTEPTREKIINSLKSNGHMTVSDLADSIGISQIAVRHHLNSLQADQMIEAREERHGVGRPRQVFHLTDAALEGNSSTYLKLTNLLLDQLKEHIPPEMVEKLFLEVASSMAGDFKEQLSDLPLPQRIERLANLLTQEGFVARFEPVSADEFRLIELSCPYSKISLQHPEMCVLDASMISRALDASVERKTCIRTGSDSCTFAIAGRREKPE